MSRLDNLGWRKHGTVGGLMFIALALVCQIAFAQSKATLEVKGSLVAGRSFTLRDFAALPQTEISETRALGTGHQQESAQVKWRGVLLRDVLGAVNFQEKERHDFRRTVIVARASDGYIAVFSWGELLNSKLGDSVLVITSVDGKPLSDAEGPYALRSLGDMRPGPRHVKWLQQIEITTLH